VVNKVAICNMALARINQKPIQSITETNSVAAQFCNLFYDPTRRWLLRQHPFGFAKSSDALALTTEEALGWDYVYQKPSASLRIWSLTSLAGNSSTLSPVFRNGEMVYAPSVKDGSTVEFDVFGDKIYTNLEDAYAIYSNDIEDTTKFDDGFIDSLAWRLAYEVSMPITGKLALRKLAKEGFDESIAVSMSSSSNERRVAQTVGSDLVEARR